MQLPSTIEKLFDSTYNEMRAARLKSAMECNNLQTALRLEGLSFDTKIVKHKKKGKEFIVMLVESHGI